MPGEEASKAYRPWQLRIFAATWLTYVGYYFGRKAFYVVKPALADALGIDAVVVAQLGTAYLVGYMLGQFSSAFFGRRLGPKLLLLVGLGVTLACNLVFGTANGFWTVAVFLTVNGLVQGTGWPGCIGSLAHWFRREQRGSILGVWATCYQVGSLVATSFAAWLLGHWGWRSSFYGSSLVILAIWFAVLALHPNRPEDVGLEPLEPEPEPTDEAGAPRRWSPRDWSRQTWVTLLMMGTVYFSIKFLRYALWSWSTWFLDRNFHMAGDEAGYLSTVFDLAGFAGVVVAGFVTDRFFHGRRAFVSLAMLVGMTLGFVTMYALGATSLGWFAVSLGLVGFMLYGPDSLLSGVGAIDVGGKRGALAAAGIINGMGSAGPIFQEQVIGWMYEHYHHDLLPIFLVFVGVAAVGTLVTARIWWNARQGRADL